MASRPPGQALATPHTTRGQPQQFPRAVFPVNAIGLHSGTTCKGWLGVGCMVFPVNAIGLHSGEEAGQRGDALRGGLPGQRDRAP